MTAENRKSGAVIYTNVVVKVGDNLKRQGEFMASRKDVFCPIILVTTEGYYMMPNHIPFSNRAPVAVIESALQKLTDLWYGLAEEKDNLKEYNVVAHRADYVEYVMSTFPDIQATNKLRTTILAYYDAVLKHCSGDEKFLVNFVHGDATLQNIVWDGGTEEAFWIDPNCRKVPLERALDIGKLLQSLEGYDQYTLSQAIPILNLYNSLTDEEKLLARFYCLTHFARLWRYQDVDAKTLATIVAENYMENLHALTSRI